MTEAPASCSTEHTDHRPVSGRHTAPDRAGTGGRDAASRRAGAGATSVPVSVLPVWLKRTRDATCDEHGDDARREKAEYLCYVSVGWCEFLDYFSKMA